LEGIGGKLSMNTIAAYLEVVREITNTLIHDILSIQRDLIPVPPEYDPTTGLSVQHITHRAEVAAEKQRGW